MSTLSEILTQYREGSRGLPDYHELQQIASDQPLRAAAQQAANFMRVFIERKTYLADWPDHVLSQLEAALSAQPTDSVPQPAQERVTNDEDFKNFHHNLCVRFDYCHDEKDWKRDQVSLIEYIAKKVQQAQPAQRDSMDAVKERLADMEAERNVWHAGYVEASKAWDTAKTELSAMTAERDELKSNYAFLETSLRYMQDVRDKWEEAAFRNIKLADHLIDERDKWKQAYNDAIAEVRKLAEELGTLKGERDALADEVARHCGMLKSVAWDLENGFIRCIRCGDQEQLSTTDMAYALRDYFAAITAQGEKP